MSAIIHGFSITQLEPQPDFRASKSETGEWTATQTFWHRKGSFGQSAIQAKIREGTRIYTLDPNFDPWFIFLKVSAIKDIDTQDGGLAKISLEFKGFPVGAVVGVDDDIPFSGQDASANSSTTQFNPETEAEVVYPTYHLRGTVEEASIFTHKKFTALSATNQHILRELANGTQKMLASGEIGNEVVLSDGSIIFAPYEMGSSTILTGDALSFAQRILEGRTTWKTASFEWVRKWTSTQPIAAVELNKVGKICGDPEKAPAAGATRNWMFRDVNQEQTGSVDSPVYQCEATFILSPIGGFDTFLQT